ncbi:hypothetical protein ZTR_09728 [Talaromyces verruculosus]|nr:hypothetical protein ZTR_09728 [Talaromyces verruculosus]
MSTTTSPTTIALFGSTGKTGRVILRLLLAKNLYNLKVYVRSRETLIALFPGITTDPLVQLFVGAVTDQTIVQQCLSGVQIVICTLGNNDFGPTTILRESAQSIITALKALKKRDNRWQRPRMIYLSSSSRNQRFATARPKLVHWLIETAFHNGYADLKAAQHIILANPSLATVLLVQPGVLVDEPGTGYELSTDAVKLAASYEDLGSAFVELALERGYDDLHEVGVSSQAGNQVARYIPIIFSRISMGLFVCYFPRGPSARAALERVFPWLP